MLLLEYHNLLIYTLLSDRFTRQQQSNVDQLLSDFDGVLFHISTPQSKSKIQISISIRCFSDLVKYGARELLEREYGDMIVDAENNFDFSIVVDLEKIGSLSVEEKDNLAKKISMMKRNAVAAPFERAFKLHEQLSATFKEGEEQKSGEVMSIHYREEEAIYITPKHDRVTVIFSTVFREETDHVFGKVFLQEFIDARKRPNIQYAPQVLYSFQEPPLEIRNLQLKTEGIGFVTFVLFPRHFAAGEKREECISRIQVFRDALHYHIKKSKAFMHTRMRLRVAEFLKVLNRAKPDVAESEKQKKTSTGRSFSSSGRR